jgi:hypothetical protein
VSLHCSFILLCKHGVPYQPLHEGGGTDGRHRTISGFPAWRVGSSARNTPHNAAPSLVGRCLRFGGMPTAPRRFNSCSGGQADGGAYYSARWPSSADLHEFQDQWQIQSCPVSRLPPGSQRADGETSSSSSPSSRTNPLDHSYIEACGGSGAVVQKLVAAVQAGDAPDVLIHTLGSSQLHFLDIVEDAQRRAGGSGAAQQTGTSVREESQAGRQVVGRTPLQRAGGYFVRVNAFKEAGIDALRDLTDFDQARGAALKISNPTRNSGVGA